ncbi:hypothetical protein AYI69_g5783 [Smittium culicis]|uniref:DUF2423 domain-containing protein n=1 Tax=Smittium culicis TaxID=133412 RepID=A0A1R1Y3R5_9FUNG|nr:hypothetical protein AYI69_g5783 [Smittium culicis]
MAKSGRSKSRIRNANVRRINVYGPVEAERLARLADKQKIKTGTLDQVINSDEVELGSSEAPMETDAPIDEEAAKSEKKISLRKVSKHKKNSKKGNGVSKKNKFKWIPQKR